MAPSPPKSRRTSHRCDEAAGTLPLVDCGIVFRAFIPPSSISLDSCSARELRPNTLFFQELSTSIATGPHGLFSGFGGGLLNY
mmetsp:Transcript_29175/g.61950  ORF Transcript_29175/g.61950 Transcript_29175/m.61950 type:complete len:83 (-) Transcript_29175:593-841(-)